MAYKNIQSLASGETKYIIPLERESHAHYRHYLVILLKHSLLKLRAGYS